MLVVCCWFKPSASLRLRARRIKPYDVQGLLADPGGLARGDFFAWFASLTAEGLDSRLRGNDKVGTWQIGEIRGGQGSWQFSMVSSRLTVLSSKPLNPGTPYSIRNKLSLELPGTVTKRGQDGLETQGRDALATKDRVAKTCLRAPSIQSRRGTIALHARMDLACGYSARARAIARRADLAD